MILMALKDSDSHEGNTNLRYTCESFLRKPIQWLILLHLFVKERRRKWASCICARTYLHVTSKTAAFLRNGFGWSRSLVVWSRGAVRATHVSAWSLAARYFFRASKCKRRVLVNVFCFVFFSVPFFQKVFLCACGRHAEAVVTNTNGILFVSTSTLLQRNAFSCLIY